MDIDTIVHLSCYYKWAKRANDSGLRDTPAKSRPGAGSCATVRIIVAATGAGQIPAGAPARDPKTGKMGKTGKTGQKTGNKKMGRKKCGNWC